jgi:hypothetical protein
MLYYASLRMSRVPPARIRSSRIPLPPLSAGQSFAPHIHPANDVELAATSINPFPAIAEHEYGANSVVRPSSSVLTQINTHKLSNKIPRTTHHTRHTETIILRVNVPFFGLAANASGHNRRQQSIFQMHYYLTRAPELAKKITFSAEYSSYLPLLYLISTLVLPSHFSLFSSSPPSSHQKDTQVGSVLSASDFHRHEIFRPANMPCLLNMWLICSNRYSTLGADSLVR